MLLIIIIPFFSTAQQVTGKVMSEQKELLIGASVYWINTNIGTTTNADGFFELTSEGKNTNFLVASYVGYDVIWLAVLVDKRR